MYQLQWFNCNQVLCIILVFNLLVMYTGLPSLVAFPPDCKTADCVIQWVFAVHWWSFQILRFLIYGNIMLCAYCTSKGHVSAGYYGIMIL